MDRQPDVQARLEYSTAEVTALDGRAERTPPSIFPAASSRTAGFNSLARRKRALAVDPGTAGRPPDERYRAVSSPGFA